VPFYLSFLKRNGKLLDDCHQIMPHKKVGGGGDLFLSCIFSCAIRLIYSLHVSGLGGHLEFLFQQSYYVSALRNRILSFD
jgi:hypothetical protein